MPQHGEAAGATIRPATVADVPTVAGMHRSEIAEGFLSSLGAGFLCRLYRRVVRSPQGILLVADGGATLAGFVAATTDVAALYRSFVLRDGLAAGFTAAPRLVRSWRRVVETLRYPAHSAGLPTAEILAVAVAPGHRGRGLGRQLVAAATDELYARGIAAAKVVTAGHNHSALAMYRSCGFRPAASFELHPGVVSEVLTWP